MRSNFGAALQEVQRENEEFGHEHPAETSSPGSPPLPAPQLMLGELPSQQLAEQQGTPSTAMARACGWRGNRKGGCSQAEWAVRPDYARHDGKASRAQDPREQTMLLRGVWQMNLGQNLYILMKKQRPLSQGILWKEQTKNLRSESFTVCTSFSAQTTVVLHIFCNFHLQYVTSQAHLGWEQE